MSDMQQKVPCQTRPGEVEVDGGTHRSSQRFAVRREVFAPVHF